MAGWRALVGQLSSVGIGKESYCSFVKLEFEYIILKVKIMLKIDLIMNDLAWRKGDSIARLISDLYKLTCCAEQCVHTMYTQSVSIRTNNLKMYALLLSPHCLPQILGSNSLLLKGWISC